MPSPDDLERALEQELTRARLPREIEETAALSDSHHMILRLLVEDPETDHSVSTLTSALALDVSTVSRHVTAASELGLLSGHPSPRDGRVTHLSVTPLGRRLLRQSSRERNAMLGCIVGGWEGSDLRDFTRLLRRFNRAARDQ